MKRFMGPCLVLVGLLAGCSASDVVISGTGSTGLPYNPSYVRYVISQGDVPLEIHGNPSPLEEAAFVSLVESRLRLDPAFGAANLRTDPAMRNRHSFRVVLAFNPDNAALDPRKLCRGDGLDKAGGPNATLRVRGAFCERDAVLSANGALANTPEDFRGARFQLVLDQLMLEMMPSEGRRDVNENCPTMANC